MSDNKVPTVALQRQVDGHGPRRANESIGAPRDQRRRPVGRQVPQQGIDLGVDWTPDDSLTLNLTGFYESFRNELVTQSPGAGLQNFTFNGISLNEEAVQYSVDPAFVAENRILFAARWGGEVA